MLINMKIKKVILRKEYKEMENKFFEIKKKIEETKHNYFVIILLLFIREFKIDLNIHLLNFIMFLC